MEENETHPNVAHQLVQHKSVISLAFLFYLVTIGAIISACLRTLAIDQATTTQWVLAVVFSGIVSGLIAGGLVGVFYFKRWSAGMLGTLVGSCAGAIAGTLTLVKIDHYMEITLVAFAGCWLMIIVMLVAARFQQQLDL